MDALIDPFPDFEAAQIFIRVRRDEDNFMSARGQFQQQCFNEHADAAAQINGILEAEGDFHRAKINFCPDCYHTGNESRETGLVLAFKAGGIADSIA